MKLSQAFLFILVLYPNILPFVKGEEELKCENEGCYEVIKTFVKLLEEKINETDKILAEAEKELNEVTHGNDGNFRNKIKEIDNQLSQLLTEMTTGLDAGEHNLFELINAVYKAVDNTELNVNEIELILDDGIRTLKIADVEFTDVQEVIKKVQEEYDRLRNSTEEDLPKALQDAFDKSDKFHSNNKDLQEILHKMKAMLAEYESNLINASLLTKQTIDEFAEISSIMEEELKAQKEVENQLKEANELKLPAAEVKYMKKLSREASEEAKKVFDIALELLNDVTLWELNIQLDDIKSHVGDLEKFSMDTDGNLAKFIAENSKFLDDLEETMLKAEEVEQKAIKQKEEIQVLLNEIEDIKNTAEKATKETDEIVETAKNIYNTLEDFTMKVEESSERARILFEKVPEILDKLTESIKIIENLENQVENNATIANETKKKYKEAEKAMEDVLEESESVTKNTEQLADTLDSIFDDMKKITDDSEEISNTIDKLKKSEGEDEVFAGNVKEKIERTQSKIQQVDGSADDAVKNLEDIVNQTENIQEIDSAQLDEFEKSIIEAESALIESKLNERLKALKDQRQQQKELIESYKVEIAVLEHEVNIIKENSESLEDRCFKRTRLEP